MTSLKLPIALSFALTFALAGQARAAITFPSFESTGYNPKVLAKDRAAPKSSRKPSANKLVGEQDLQDDFKKAGGFRERFLKINAAENVKQGDVGLAEFLDQAEKEYAGYSPDVKFFVAQLETIRPLRSIVFRMRKLSEKNKSIEASAVMMMKSFASVVKIYLPTDQWKAGWDYITLPTRDVNVSDRVNHQFESVAELQQWAAGNREGDLAKALADASGRIFALYQDRVDHRGQKPIVLDNQLAYGTGTFPDGLDRYRTFENPEILTALSTLQMSLHSIYVFAAYNQEQFFDYFAEVGRKAGVGQVLDPNADVGLSAQDRYDILMGNGDLVGKVSAAVQKARDRLHGVKREKTASKYANFLTLTSQPLMTQAGRNLAAAVNYMDTAWVIMQSMGVNSYAWIDPGKVKPSKREIDLRLKTMVAMTKGQTQIKSALTGERVCVDLPQFFNHSPEDLKDYFAIGFKTDIPSDDTITVKGHTLNYRNYDHGRAIAWDQAKWGEYVKVVATNAGNDCKDVGPQTATSMGDALKILRQSWGGDYVSPVVDFVMR